MVDSNNRESGKYNISDTEGMNNNFYDLYSNILIFGKKNL